MKQAPLSRRASPLGALVPVLLALLALASSGCEPAVLDFFPTDSSDDGAGTGGAPPQPPSAPELIVSQSLDLSQHNTGARSCPDGGDIVSYRAAELSGHDLSLTTTPSPGCWEAGDELLLIKLQGSADSLANVGEHELLRISSIDGPRLTLVAAALRHYGNAVDSNAELTDGVVLVQRVPSYSRLEVAAGAMLTAAGWTGESGGVLALRVLGDTVLQGSLDMSGRGFRGGASPDAALAHGQQGESWAGPGDDDTAPNHGGGGGGLGDQTTTACVQDGNAGGGGAHLSDGEDAVLVDLCSGEGRGRGGQSYAQPGLLFLGSGGGSGGVDNIRRDNPPGGAGGAGGGIVWLLSQSVTGTGGVRADGADGAGDEPGLECQDGGSTGTCYDHSGPGGGGAGGSVRVTAPVRSVLRQAAGGLGGNGNDTSSGNGGNGSPGVIE